MAKQKLSNITKDDKDFKKEGGVVSVDLDVQEFDGDFSSIELTEELNKQTISYMERLIRSSYEYKQYIGYLKNELDITSCAITPSLDIREYDIHLEMHHYPFTLYDIVETIAKEMLAKKKTEKVSMFKIADAVMKEHYEGNIGLVPLTKTAHEQAHNFAVKIPAVSINGKYDKFIAKHRAYITPETLDKAMNAKLITMADAEAFNSNKLKLNIMHYNIKYNKQKQSTSEQ